MFMYLNKPLSMHCTIKILGILVHVLTIQYFYELKMKDINHLAPYEWPRRNSSLQYQYNVNTM